MSLFDNIDVLGGNQAEDETLRYLVDLNEWHANQPPRRIPPDPTTYSKESLAQRPGMEWLSTCDMFLMYPDVPKDKERQADQLQRVFQQLLSEATVLPAGFCSAFPEDYSAPLLGIDTETTGLDMRTRYGFDGFIDTRTKIVGLCVATSDTRGYYFPVLHTEEDGVPNWEESAIIEFIDKLNATFALIWHNAGYDREVCALNGCKVFRGWPYFFDTQVLDFFHDVNVKVHGLKPKSVVHLGRKMIEIQELMNGLGHKTKEFIQFDTICATTAYVYGCSDACNTFGLFKFYAGQPQERNMFFMQAIPLQIDHKLSDVNRDMCRPGLPINFEYFYYAAKDAIYRLGLMEQAIYELVGRRFAMGSPKQLSELLFDEYKIPPLEGMEKGKTGAYSTAEDILDQLYAKYPDFLILKYIVLYRKVQATISKIYLKAIANSYVCALMPYAHMQLSFSQTNVPTGRLSSNSSDGAERVEVKESDKTNKLSYKYEKGSWDCGMNSQGIPSQAYRLAKAKRLIKIPEASGVDLSKPYPDWVHKQFVKLLAAP